MGNLLLSKIIRFGARNRMKNSKRLSRDLVQEPFHDKILLQETWGEYWGVSTDIGHVKKVLMHRPGDEILRLHQNVQQIEMGSQSSGDIKGRTPEDLQTTGKPNLPILQTQHDHLVSVLKDEGIEVVYLEGESKDYPERIFTRDLGMVIPSGVIVSRLALYIRYGESFYASQTFSRLGIPILGTIQGNGFVEGGSFSMLDEKTALIGRSERVNLSGIEQLRQILSIQNIQLITIDLPSTIIHLDEAFLLLDQNKALVNKALLPYWFIDELQKRQFELLHIDPEDHPLSINALPIAPGRIVFSSTAVRTMEVLDKNGLEVIPVDISEFYKLGGGIHCLTLPLVREK
jgi:N-dimethylarginine dimethylaminohydrolase